MDAALFPRRVAEVAMRRSFARPAISGSPPPLLSIGVFALGLAVSPMLTPPPTIAASPLAGKALERQTPRGALSEVESGDPGEPIQCLDVRTGGSFRFQAQRLLASGTVDTVWTPDSTQVCVGMADGIAQRLIPDEAGGAFVVWVDQREGYPDVRLGRVDDAGASSPGWSPEGLPLSPFTAARDHVAGCSDGSGGVYIGWSEFRGTATSCIRLVRVGSNGALLAGWPGGGVLVGSGGREQAHPWVSAVPGGVLVTWLERHEGRLGLRAQRLTADGTRAAGWADEGAEVVAGPVGGHVTRQRAVVRPNGEVLVVWREDHTGGTASIRTAQIPIETPPMRLTTEVRTLSSDATFLSDPALAVADEHVLVAWAERGSRSEGVRLVRLVSSGVPDPAWPAAGALVAQSAIGFDPPAILPQPDGGAVVAWTDRREVSSGDIYAGRVLADGTPDPGWPASGVPACTALGDQYRPAIMPDGSGGAIVSWLDVATQEVAGFLSTSAYAVGPVELVETTLDPGRVRLAWRAPVSADAIYRAYRRLTGAAWAHVSDLAPTESGRLELDDREAPEGQAADYALSVERGGVERFLAPIVVQVPATPERLALRRIALSGSGDAVRVEFALPRGPEARLELIDVAGRRVGERRLTGFEPGERAAEVGGHGRIRAGVYFVRLRQGAVVLTQKFVAVP